MTSYRGIIIIIRDTSQETFRIKVIKYHHQQITDSKQTREILKGYQPMISLYKQQEMVIFLKIVPLFFMFLTYSTVISTVIK